MGPGHEWSNHRLCTGIVDSKKGELLELADPIGARVGWFELDLVTFRVCEVRRPPRRITGRSTPLCRS